MLIFRTILSKSTFNYLKMFRPSRDQADLLFRSRYALSIKSTLPVHPKNKLKQQSNDQSNPPQKKSNKNSKQTKKQETQKNAKFQIKTPKGTRDYPPEKMAIRRKVIDTIVEVFRKHGGLQLDTPVFELKDVLTGKYGEDSKLIYDLEDQGGEKCSLRYDLTVPFARFMAENTNIAKIKRFHIGKVYRRDQPTINKGRFRQFYQCDFDIAGKYDAMIPDAQILAIMQEVLEAVGVDEFKVKVNHRKVLQAVINQALCDREKFKTICSSIDKLDKLPWAQVKQQLVKVKGVSEQSADMIGRLTELKGDPEQVLEKIKNQNIFKKEAQNLIPVINEMQKLFSYLKAFERYSKVSFDLSLARGLDYYTGLIYEIVLTDKKTELGSISGGGRYDDLIGMFCAHQIPSVGGSIGIQRLFTILQKKYLNKVKKNANEVLVATVGKIPVQQKLRILNRLWKLDIKAETLYVEKGNPKRQIDHAFDNEIPLIIFLGEDELKKGVVKIKVLYKHEQCEVPLQNLNEEIIERVNSFRKDFQEGKIDLKVPQKK